MRWIAAPVALLWTMACTGSSPEAPPDPPPTPPTEEPQKKKPAPERPKKQKNQPCLKGVVGVLGGLPGLPSGDGWHKGVHAGPVSARLAPDADTRALFVFTAEGIDRAGERMCDTSDCHGIGFAYETRGLPVYGIKKGWARVGIPKKKIADGTMCSVAFIEIEPPITAVSAKSLYADGWVDPLETWDGRVANKAGGDLKKGVDFSGAILDVDQIEEVDGALWIHGTFRQNPCEDFKKDLGEGWVPVQDQDGFLQMDPYIVC